MRASITAGLEPFRKSPGQVVQVLPRSRGTFRGQCWAVGVGIALACLLIISESAL
jgi:hypothetical protein